LTGSCGIDTLSILGRFREFCRVDLQQAERTVSGHLYQMKHFLKAIGKDPAQATTEDVRAYLSKFQDRSANTRANVLKSLKRFYCDFLKKPEMVESFKFPKRTYTPKQVPSRSDLKRFFDVL